MRTFQRRVSAWRALNGSELLSREGTDRGLTLEQVHQPGEVMQTDGTWMTELGIRINEQEFPHLLIHSVLPYSNWEWGRVAAIGVIAGDPLGIAKHIGEVGACSQDTSDRQHNSSYPQTGARSPRKESGRTRIQ